MGIEHRSHAIVVAIGVILSASTALAGNFASGCPNSMFGEGIPLGNPCSTSAECCSGYCRGGVEDGCESVGVCADIILTGTGSDLCQNAPPTDLESNGGYCIYGTDTGCLMTYPVSGSSTDACITEFKKNIILPSADTELGIVYSKDLAICCAGFVATCAASDAEPDGSFLKAWALGGTCETGTIDATCLSAFKDAAGASDSGTGATAGPSGGTTEPASGSPPAKDAASTGSAGGTGGASAGSSSSTGNGALPARPTTSSSRTPAPSGASGGASSSTAGSSSTTDASTASTTNTAAGGAAATQAGGAVRQPLSVVSIMVLIAFTTVSAAAAV